MTVAVRALAQDEHRLYYEHNGYVVLPGQISHALIDSFLSLYQRDIRHSRAKFYRHHTHAYERNRFTGHGHVIQSFLDVHDYKRFPEFRQAALDIFFSPAMRHGLTQTTGHARHHLMQSMLFDANAATPPHQDWWDLDTVPNGHLVGAWIALEDIRQEAGRFYVLPGSQNSQFHEPNLPHAEWLGRMCEYMERHRALLHAPALRKGDVLIWNSRTIHGALETQDPRHSRKSLTAHFMPSTMTFGNLFTAQPWIPYVHYGEHQYFARQPEHSLKAEWVSRLKGMMHDSPRLQRWAYKFHKKSVTDV